LRTLYASSIFNAVLLSMLWKCSSESASACTRDCARRQYVSRYRPDVDFVWMLVLRKPVSPK